jgi:hypothetical protein
MIAASAAVAIVLNSSATFKAASSELRNLPQPGAFEIDASPSGASIERQGRIEQRTSSGWETAFGEYYLVNTCNGIATAPACIALAPGAVLRPVPWNGYTCDGQCPRACKGNAYRPPGDFRLVLTQCGGGAELFGAPFSMGQASAK